MEASWPESAHAWEPTMDEKGREESRCRRCELAASADSALLSASATGVSHSSHGDTTTKPRTLGGRRQSPARTSSPASGGLAVERSSSSALLRSPSAGGLHVTRGVERPDTEAATARGEVALPQLEALLPVAVPERSTADATGVRTADESRTRAATGPEDVDADCLGAGITVGGEPWHDSAAVTMWSALVDRPRGGGRWETSRETRGACTLEWGVEVAGEAGTMEVGA